MMEKTKIGLNAGKVWRILNEKGELSMFDLCRELSLTFEDVALAIGWLAREDKIFLRKREGMLFASIEMSNLLLAKVVANLHLRWISTLLFTLLKSNEVDQ